MFRRNSVHREVLTKDFFSCKILENASIGIDKPSKGKKFHQSRIKVSSQRITQLVRRTTPNYKLRKLTFSGFTSSRLNISPLSPAEVRKLLDDMIITEKALNSREDSSGLSKPESTKTESAVFVKALS